MKATLATPIAFGVHLQRCWGSCERDVSKCHRAELVLGRFQTKEEAYKLVSIPEEDDPIRKDPRTFTCKHCGVICTDAEDRLSAGSYTIYDTPSGKLTPGNLFWCDWYGCAENGKCLYGWTNCDGKHLMAILPNGHHWDIHSRASNCTMKDDGLHRCWVISGTVPDITVGKGGVTCGAGAGSIAVPGYHGFLQNGHFTPNM